MAGGPAHLRNPWRRLALVVHVDERDRLRYYQERGDIVVERKL